MRVLAYLLLIPITFVAASQHHLNAYGQDPLGARVYDAGFFSPVEDLRNLLESQYTILKHPGFPGHSVRIKESKFCDQEVR